MLKLLKNDFMHSEQEELGRKSRQKMSCFKEGLRKIIS